MLAVNRLLADAREGEGCPRARFDHRTSDKHVIPNSGEALPYRATQWTSESSANTPASPRLACLQLLASSAAIHSPTDSSSPESVFKDTGTNSAALTLGTNGFALTFSVLDPGRSCRSITASSSSCSHESGAVSRGSIVASGFSPRKLSCALFGPVNVGSSPLSEPPQAGWKVRTSSVNLDFLSEKSRAGFCREVRLYPQSAWADTSFPITCCAHGMLGYVVKYLKTPYSLT